MQLDSQETHRDISDRPLTAVREVFKENGLLRPSKETEYKREAGSLQRDMAGLTRSQVGWCGLWLLSCDCQASADHR